MLVLHQMRGFPPLQGTVFIEEKCPFRKLPGITARRLLWAFYRKLLSASYGVPLCQPQIVPDRMQRLSDKLDCNSSAIAVAGDTRSCSAHICGIGHARSFILQ